MLTVGCLGHDRVLFVDDRNVVCVIEFCVSRRSVPVLHVCACGCGALRCARIVLPLGCIPSAAYWVNRVNMYVAQCCMSESQICATHRCLTIATRFNQQMASLIVAVGGRHQCQVRSY